MFYLAPGGKLVTYWDLPTCQVPNNSRVGSVSIHFAITQKFHGQCPCISGAPTKPVLALIRDPVERYRSAMVKAVEDRSLGNHFSLQCELLIGQDVRLYRFPEHLEQFVKDTGLGSITWSNKSPVQKPELTPQQVQDVLERYKKDVEIYASIRESGQAYVSSLQSSS